MPHKVDGTCRAFQTAVSGRPGPVVVALPEDVLSETADVEDTAQFSPARAAPSPEGLARAHDLLSAAERPLLPRARGIDRPSRGTHNPPPFHAKVASTSDQRQLLQS